MDIEFDPAKSERNRRERGFGFEDADGFDFTTALIWVDSRRAYPETRYAALGFVQGRLHALVFMETKAGISCDQLPEGQCKGDQTSCPPPMEPPGPTPTIRSGPRPWPPPP
jgi:uncharacterized DUF497 family protein